MNKLLNPYWLGCRILLVVLIRVSGSFYESKLLGNDYIDDPKCLGEDLWKFGRFRV